jgi:hypothetical protein
MSENHIAALEEQMRMPGISELDFFERFALPVDREFAERENRRKLSFSS